MANPLTAEQSSAKATIDQFFAMTGLSSLAPWAWQQYLSGSPVEQVFLDIRQRPEYKARYPAMEELARRGQAISEAAYISYEKTAQEYMTQFGVPYEMYGTPDGIAGLMLANVSTNEIRERLQIAAGAATTAPQEVRDALRDKWNVDTGGLIAYYLDPAKAEPILKKQYAAAQIAGAGTQQKVDLSVATAERLAAQGVTYDQAYQGLGQVAATEGLGGGFGEVADQAARTAAVFGDAAAQVAVKRTQQSRAAQFAGSGQGVESQQGIGLGSSSTT